MKLPLLSRRHKGPSVKEAFDNLPSGIVFFDEKGIAVLCNRQMHRLSFALTGRDIQSQEELEKALETLPAAASAIRDGDLFLLPNGEAWNFEHQTVTDGDGVTYAEFVASNVTELRRSKIELEESNRNQEDMIRRKQHISSNVETIAHSEAVLAMKMKIHNDLGVALTSVRHFLSEGCPLNGKDMCAAEQVKMAKTLRGEIEGITKADAYTALREVAEKINMKIVTEGELPQSEDLRRLLAFAVRECLTNTARHAGGDTVYLKLSTNKNELKAEITNNGRPPAGEITEGGGLTSLREKLECSGGKMSITSRPQFVMKIQLPTDAEAY